MKKPPIEIQKRQKKSSWNIIGTYSSFSALLFKLREQNHLKKEF